MRVILKNIGICLLISIAIRIIYVIFAFAYFKIAKSEPMVIGPFLKDISDPISYYKHFIRFDSYWYENIAKNGYPIVNKISDLYIDDKGVTFQSVWAFFPLYPFMIRILSVYIGLDTGISFFIISMIFSTMAFFQFNILMKIMKANKRTKIVSFILLFLSPFTYFNYCFYTESIALSLSLLLFNSLYYNRYWYSYLCAILLPLLKVNGLMLLGTYLFLKEIKDYKAQTLFLYLKESLIKNFRFLAVGLISFSLYCLYQFKMTNTPFAFVFAQKGWDRKFGLTFDLLFNKWHFNLNDSDRIFESLIIIIFLFVVLFLLLPNFKKKAFPFTFSLVVFLPPFLSHSLISIPRFISIIFPYYNEIGTRISKMNTLLLICILSYIVYLHFLTFGYWLRQSWFSI